MNDEYLDLVDETDCVIGRALRSIIYEKGLHNYRVVNAFIQNSKGELWVPVRTAQKKIFPNALDFSVGGHVESGEEYDKTFIRETKEELSIDLHSTVWRSLGRLSPVDGVSSWMTVYEISSDRTPDFNPDDYVSASWIAPKQLMHMIQSGEDAKSDILPILQRFYLP